MASKNDNYDRVSRDRLAAKVSTLVGSLSQEQLERLTIDAIRKHRDALGKAEAAYEAWKAHSANRHSATASTIYEAYVRLMLAHEAQYVIVATLVERLGQVPNVPDA